MSVITVAQILDSPCFEENIGQDSCNPVLLNEENDPFENSNWCCTWQVSIYRFKILLIA